MHERGESVSERLESHHMQWRLPWEVERPRSRMGVVRSTHEGGEGDVLTLALTI